MFNFECRLIWNILVLHFLFRIFPIHCIIFEITIAYKLDKKKYINSPLSWKQKSITSYLWEMSLNQNVAIVCFWWHLFVWIYAIFQKRNINELLLIQGTAENLSKLLSHSVSFIIYKLTWNVNLLLGQCHIWQIDLCFC